MPIPADLLESIFATSGPSQKPKRGDEIFEGTDYPQTWDGFIGQTKAKEQLRVAVASARARGAHLDHVLLASGIAGVGKTTLATLLTAELGVGFLQTSGPLTIDDARDLLTSCEDGDVLFIDEAHLLVQGGRTKADWLLPYMLEGKLYGPRGAEDMPRVTIVAATTDVGVLPETLIGRFMLAPQIVPYTEVEGQAIAHNLAQRMNTDGACDQTHYAAIAKASDNNPRAMRKVLTQVRDLSYAYPETVPNLDTAFDFAGVAPDGLTVVAREILVLLLVAPGGTLAQDSIRAQLGEPGPLQHHEKQLMQRGLIHVTGRGRKLTEPGLERAITAARELQDAV